MKKAIACLALLALVVVAPAEAAKRSRLELYYSPEDNLEKIDSELIDAAVASIDIAAYVLTDIAVIEALQRAAARGVKVRLFREPMQLRDDKGTAVDKALEQLLATPGVEARENPRHVWMHLKSFSVDDALLRLGAANFSAQGLKHQDNDLLVTDDRALLIRFKKHFETMWKRQ